MLIRLDDYPAGIRPIQPGQLNDFDRMIKVFATYDLTLYVGVVPITYRDTGHHLHHPNVRVCMHGYDHNYSKNSQRLIDLKDPFNQSSIGIFNEFEGLRHAEILDRLVKGKAILEKSFGEVDTYIPVCNTIDRQLAKMIHRAGFKRILCENLVQSDLPIIKSDFYGRLCDLPDKPMDVITLHLPWEWDTIQKIGWKLWEQMVQRLAARELKQRVDPVKPAPVAEIDYRILWKFPIRWRRDKFFDTLDKYYSLFSTSKNNHFLVTIDDDDVELNTAEVKKRLKGYTNLICQVSNCTNKIQAVNRGVESQQWDIVVVVSDDMIPQVNGLDQIIRSDMARYFPNLDGALWYNDGFQGDAINTIQIMGRRWFDRWGYIYHEDYVSQRCDVEYQKVAKRFDRIKYINNVIIRHEHADFGLAEYDKLLLHNYTFIRRDELMFYQRESIGFAVRIPKVAHFIWNEGTPLSYLRYLTIQTFRLHHPDWKVMFHLVSGCNQVKGWKGKESLEFIENKKVRDYIKELPPAEIVSHTVDNLLPNHASDLIRWEVLYQYGGFYFDLDQLILASFDPLTDYDIVYGGSRIVYSGVLGMFRRCPVALEMINRVKAKIKSGTTSYCEAGNWLWDHYLTTKESAETMRYYRWINTPQESFYPISESHMMKQYYDGGTPDLVGAYALHWFGGHPDSQVFNRLSNQQIDEILKRWNINT